MRFSFRLNNKTLWIPVAFQWADECLKEEINLGELPACVQKYCLTLEWLSRGHSGSRLSRIRRQKDHIWRDMFILRLKGTSGKRIPCPMLQGKWLLFLLQYR